VAAQATWNDATISEVGSAPGAALSVAGRLASVVLLHDVPLEPGDPIPGVARYTGRIGVDAALTSSVESRAGVRLSGPFTPIGEPSVRTRAYAVADLGATVRLGRAGPSLDLDLLNLLSAKYPELRASGFLNPGAPRALRMALRLGHAE
jgi:hypothetical protein